MKKVGRNVYGSGDTIVTKTSHFFQGLTLGAEGGGACTRYFTVNKSEMNSYNYCIIYACDQCSAKKLTKNIHGDYRHVIYKFIDQRRCR